MTNNIDCGSSFPLGATVAGDGVNFSLYSKSASTVELLFFDTADCARPSRVISLDRQRHRTYHYWHAFVPQTKPGQLYGYRVHGSFDPASGLRFDPQKVLLDPYGRAVAIPRDYDRTAASRPGDNAAQAMKSVVADAGGYDWEGDRPLRHPYARTVIYEMHLAGFTRHPNSGVAAQTRHVCWADRENSLLAGLRDHRGRTVARLSVRSSGLPTGPGELLGILPGVVLCSAPGLQLPAGSAGCHRRVSRYGEGAAPGGH